MPNSNPKQAITLTGNTNPVVLAIGSPQTGPKPDTTGTIVFYGSFSAATVQVEGQTLDGNWCPLGCVDAGSGAFFAGGTAITLTAGLLKMVRIDITGFVQFRVWAASLTGTLNVSLYSDFYYDSPLSLVTSANTTLSGSSTITSISLNALAVGPAGTTNPTFNVDASAGSAVTGLDVVGKASGSGITLIATGSSATVGEAITVTGGTSTGANAGGVSALLGGTAGATGAGGAATVTGAAGGATSGTGGAATVTAGAGTTNSAGGVASLVGGAGAGTGAGGAAAHTGGLGGTTGAGGAVTVTGGAGGATSGTGGAASVIAGAGTGTTAVGGLATLRGGASAGASGTAGGVAVDTGAATGGTKVAVIIGDVNAGSTYLNRGPLAALQVGLTLTALGTVQSSTPTSAQLLGGYLTQTGATGAGTITLPTGTALSTACNRVPVVGDSFRCVFANLGGGQTLTVTGATGTTVVSGGAIATAKSATLEFINTGSNAWSISVVGG